MIKKYRKNKLKGSVLYTVVAVMMIMTVFVFAALTLASAANRRAFNSYANNQTQYTARSVVETVWEQIESIPEIGKKIDVLSKSGVGSELSFDEIKIPDSSMGEVTGAKVTYLGKGIDYGYDIDDNFYKLSVTVKMLGQENTLAGYFLPEKIENPSFDYALVSLDSVGSNNFDVYGPLSFGSTKFLNVETFMANDGKLSSPIQFNGDLSIRSADNVNMTAKSGMFVNGNFNFSNGGILKPVITSQLLYRELPYLYVDKCFNYYSTSSQIGSNNSPMLIMADSINHSSDATAYPMYGDVYLYGQYSASTISSGQILTWNNATNIIAKNDNAKNGAYTGGNLYSLGVVNVQRSGVLANNVVADTLNLNNSTSTTGTVVTRKLNISLLNGNTFDFKKGLFVYPENLSTISKNVKLLGSDVAVKSNNLYYPLFDASQLMLYQYNTDSIKVNWSTNEWWLGDINPNNVSGTLIDSYGNNIAILKNFNMSNRSFTLEFVSNFNPNDWVYLIINGLNNHEIKIIDYEVTSKFPNAIDYIRSVNDIAFNNNSNVIYIDDIDKSVKITRLVDEYGTPVSMEISKADLTGIEEGNETSVSYSPVEWTDYYGSIRTDFSYDSEYAEFLRTVVNTVTFPESMKKDKVLKSNGGFVDNSILNTKNGVSELQSHAEEESAKAFEHIDETENLIYDFESNKIFNKENVERGDITFPLNVTSSCTFKGNLGQNDFINIIPSSEKVYIKLDNFSMENGCQKKDMIIVDDDNGTKSAVFLIPKGQDITIVGNVLTNYYKNNSEIIKDPIKYDTIIGKNVVDSEKIPGIYFYMENDTTRMSKLRFEFSHTSAYIVLPTGKLESDVNSYDRSYKYNGEDIGIKNNAIIGAVICKEVSVAANNRFFAYVNPNPKLDEDSEEELTYKPRCIYYQAY